jgi:hypothetical protein
MDKIQRQEADSPSFPQDDYIIAEFISLREEILKRTEFQFQIVGLTLLIAGTFFTLGVQSSVSSQTLAVYPILAFFLAVFWAHNYVGTIEAGAYIRYMYEKHLSIGGWETFNYRIFSVENPKRRSRLFRISLNTLAARGVFIITQLLTLALSAVHSSFSNTDLVLLGSDALAIIATFFAIRNRRVEIFERTL